MDQMSKTEFKARALEVLRNIEQTGKPKVITDHGRPTIEIRKLRQTAKTPLEILKDTIVSFDDPTRPVSEDDWDLAK